MAAPLIFQNTGNNKTGTSSASPQVNAPVPLIFSKPQNSPAFQAARNNQQIRLNTPQPSPSVYPKESIVNRPTNPQARLLENQPQKSLWDTAKEMLGQAGNTLKNSAQQVPEYAKSAVKNPGEAVAGAGANILTSFSSLAGLVEHGIANSLGKQVPERIDISKQTEALKELNKMVISKSPNAEQKQKAFDTGQFIGAVIPYALGGEVTTLTSAKTLLPLTSRFLPQAVKFVPAINEAVSIAGVGQIIHDKENGTRIDQLKNDLIMFGLFKVAGFSLGQSTKLLPKNVQSQITKVSDLYASKFKNGQEISLNKAEQDIAKVKNLITEVTGKKPEVLIANDIQSTDGTKLPFKIDKSTPELLKTYEVLKQNNDVVLKPKEGVQSINGTQESPTKSTSSQIPQETQKTVSKNIKAEVQPLQGTENLKSPFKNSKENRLLYHGTPGAKFKQFDISKAGTSDHGFAGKAIYLTNDKEIARYFANDWTSRAHPNKRVGSIIESYVNTHNPLIIEKSATNPYKKIQEILGVSKSEEVPIAAQKKGYDSIIIKDTRPDGSIVDEVVVFDPKNTIIKQADENLKTSKLGLRVEQTAIEKKLTQDLGDLPQYKQMNMKEQAAKASSLIQGDPERALRVALGQEAPPAGLHPESIFKALESSVTTPEMARTLANSPLVTEASTLGQRIKALDVRTSESPVEAMKQVINAREKTIQAKGGAEKLIKKTVDEVKSKVKTPDRYDWDKFISSLSC